MVFPLKPPFSYGFPEGIWHNFFADARLQVEWTDVPLSYLKRAKPKPSRGPVPWFIGGFRGKTIGKP